MRDWNLKSFRRTSALSRIACVIITISIIAGLCDCSALKKEIPKESDTVEAPPVLPQGKPGSIRVIDINGDVHETSVNIIDDAEAEENAAHSLPERTLAQVAQNLSVPDERNYAYSQLDESGKTCYREIYAILSDMLEKIELTSTDPDEVDLAFRAVMVDHPEIFYVKGYSIGKYMSGNTLKKIAFSGTYTMPEDRVPAKRDEVEAYVERVISGCPEDAGEYEKIKYVYDYLIENNDYVVDSDNNQNILSVVENGRTVCQGYTKMMQLILNRMGIFCTLVNGRACGRNGVPDSDDLENMDDAEWGGHVWNIVRCDGMYYNLDVTWGDAAIKLMNTDGSLSHDIDINYELFLVDDNALLSTHDPEPVVRMPRCNSMEDNYYQHEGLYFTGVDPDQFYRAFEAGFSSGESIIFIKCSSSDVYADVRAHLFDEQKIFEYMGSTNVRYVEFPERNLIMISL